MCACCQQVFKIACVGQRWRVHRYVKRFGGLPLRPGDEVVTVSKGAVVCGGPRVLSLADPNGSQPVSGMVTAGNTQGVTLYLRRSICSLRGGVFFQCSSMYRNFADSLIVGPCHLREYCGWCQNNNKEQTLDQEAMKHTEDT